MSLRAVIYARCSTEEEAQKNALIRQVEEAQECARSQGWLLAGSYVESRSGTTTRGRAEYNRLYDDILTDSFDIIIIKSQDRLMRSARDWYLFLERLISAQKKLYMYLERKFYATDDGLITGIKAILAEEYSRELSKKLNNAHRSRQKNNGKIVLTSNAYGYRKLQDGSVVLEGEEAANKKRMFELCATGYGCRSIANILKEEGVLNRRGQPFTGAAIYKILRNPLAKGTAVMNARHFDFETKRTVKIPAADQYVYANKVPAIVSEELWELANREMDKRAGRQQSTGTVGRNPGKSVLSGKLICGICGSPFYRSARRKYRGAEMIYEWKCRRYLQAGRGKDGNARPQVRKVPLQSAAGCDNVHLKEEVLLVFLGKVAGENAVSDKEAIIRDMIFMLKKVLQEKDDQCDMERLQQSREKIMSQMSTLLDKLLDQVLQDDLYQRKQAELEHKLEEVQEKLAALEHQQREGGTLKARTEQIETRLREGGFEKATVACMLEELDRITLFPECMEMTVSLPNPAVSNAAGDRVLRIEYGSLFHYMQKKQEEREVIIHLMQEKPQITAKIIAEKLGLSLSGANYRINALKKAGRIRFRGSGGKGTWEILG